MRVRSTANVIAVLTAACGEAASAALVEAFGGCKVDVPSWGHAERIQKSLRLKHDILTSGLSANDLAARHGVTSMWVRKLRSQLCGAAPSQLAKV